MAHGPDSSQRKQKYPGEYQESIVCAPLDDSGDHDYIPPVALSVSCLLAIVCPFCCALMVTCQVPPEPRSPLPSYTPPPLSLASMTVFIEAIPIAITIFGSHPRVLFGSPSPGISQIALPGSHLARPFSHSKILGDFLF